MIIEYAQLLSTAHRVLDGDISGKKRILPDEREFTLYQATHTNHPSAVWARSSVSHYNWLYDLFKECCAEYTNRYGKVHATSRLLPALRNTPNNISLIGFVAPPMAMPDVYVSDDVVKSYRDYYNGEKASFARWSHTPTPTWFIPREISTSHTIRV